MARGHAGVLLRDGRQDRLHKGNNPQGGGDAAPLPLGQAQVLRRLRAEADSRGGRGHRLGHLRDLRGARRRQGSDRRPPEADRRQRRRRRPDRRFRKGGPRARRHWLCLRRRRPRRGPHQEARRRRKAERQGLRGDRRWRRLSGPPPRAGLQAPGSRLAARRGGGSMASPAAAAPLPPLSALRRART
ncbi:hypothetical protein EMIHUDRAFT_453639 [Emiliania huxleyi CCMP1516]|uniref:Uncharacterized protein n=2 Tax=Emiliania huxleyi TaxID=2903 RepID=A0A0D3I3J8_EMIH1|nr:hypothetical protein EMIHUDRAFT_453639 [Emiliania huxleyi CCMP1516]EOD05833.1 hypothetical protein EMIHUDRAFT_453639 [Emiliania huxleyi CCMP1516]|eukprot:XP_005758262.1 hypothetical protein EMIHUDRAFT_453639 [Emiliania huxleyi CCMP1516]